MVAISFLVGAWLVSLPLSYVFAFVVHLDLMGLWYCNTMGGLTSRYGLTAGYGVITILATLAVAFGSWENAMVGGT